jgi:RimJ/RimL family protein N-acetyltransferase
VKPTLDTQLVTPRLIARPARFDDAAPHYEAARESLGEVGRWLTWCHGEMRLEDSEAWIGKCVDAWKRGEFYGFYLFDRTTEAFVGCATINEIDFARLRGNLGYWVRTSRQGTGMATEMVPEVARFGFERLGLQRLEVVAAVSNAASRRVATKIGAHHEGIARNRLRIHGVQHDAAVYSLIPADMKAKA